MKFDEILGEDENKSKCFKSPKHSFFISKKYENLGEKCGTFIFLKRALHFLLNEALFFFEILKN